MKRRHEIEQQLNAALGEPKYLIDTPGLKEGERYSKREFSYQSFQRSFQLPREVVDADKIEAKYENGVLKLVVPKKEEAKPRPPKTIHIN